MAHEVRSTHISIIARFLDASFRRLWGTLVEKILEVLIPVGALGYSLVHFGFSWTVLREHIWEALAPVIWAFSFIIREGDRSRRCCAAGCCGNRGSERDIAAHN